MTPNISKVFEISIKSALEHFCESRNMINHNQFGFKYQHSTIHAINLLTSTINWNWYKGYCTGAVLIDFEKAFDRVWIAGLIYKLSKMQLPVKFLTLICNMLSNRAFYVHKDSLSSDQFSMKNGIQQGTVTAPVLFNIFLHELLDKNNDMIGYADDLLVFHSGMTIEEINISLQKKYTAVENYALKWKMKINTDKCEAILFRQPVSKCNNNIKRKWKAFKVTSTLAHQEIRNKNIVKYLGVNIDQFLYFNDHVNIQIEKAKKAFFEFKNIFYSKHLSKNVKITMYKVLVRPIITYGGVIWFNISPSVMEKIRRFERHCLRVCTKSYRSPESNYVKYISNKKLYNSARIIRIDNFIIQIIRDHFRRCAFSNNASIFGPPYTSWDYMRNAIIKGYIPPEGFILLDKLGLIKNESGVPVFYHRHRRANEKSINILTNNFPIKFETSTSDHDFEIHKSLKTEAYWWLKQ